MAELDTSGGGGTPDPVVSGHEHAGGGESGEAGRSEAGGDGGSPGSSGAPRAAETLTRGQYADQVRGGSLAGQDGAPEREFSSETTADEIIEFVADVRSRSERVRASLDPRVAERLLQAAVTDADISDLDSAEVRRAQTILLNALIADEGLDSASLDAFMATARGLADRLLG